MAGRSKRDIGIFLAGLAAGVVLVLLPQWAGSTARMGEPVPVDTPAPESREAGDAQPGLTGRPGAGAAEKEAERPAYEGTPPADETPKASDALTVVIVKPVGEHWEPDDDAYIYALRAGYQPDWDDEASIPFAYEGMGFRLKLAQGGTYDIGFINRAQRVLLEDVEIKTGETRVLEVEVPPMPTARFTVEGLVLPPKHRLKVAIHESSDASHEMPGRGQPLEFNRTAEFHKDVREVTRELPDGQTFMTKASIERHSDAGWQRVPGYFIACTPSRVRAGDVVRVLLGKGVSANLMFTPEPRPRVPIWVNVKVEAVVEGHPVQIQELGVSLPGGLQEEEAMGIGLSLPPGQARVTWSGEYIKTGGTTIDVVADKPGRDFPVTIEPKTDWSVQEAYAGAPAPGMPEVRIDWRGVGTALGSDDFWPSVHGRMSDPAGGKPYVEMQELEYEEEEDGTRYWPLPPSMTRGDALVFTWRGTHVSKPIRVGRSSTLPVQMVKGGHLVVAPSELNGPGAGAWRLARADGGILLGMSPDEGDEYVSWSGLSRNVFAGTVIGPLPAGTYRFHVWLGQAQQRDVVVTINAGRSVPLVLRR